MATYTENVTAMKACMEWLNSNDMVEAIQREPWMDSWMLNMLIMSKLVRAGVVDIRDSLNEAIEHLSEFENDIVHYMGYEPRTHYSTNDRLNDLLNYLIQTKMDDACTDYLESHRDDLTEMYGEGSDEDREAIMFNALSDYILTQFGLDWRPASEPSSRG